MQTMRRLMQRKNGADRGYTLPEVLVSLALFAVLIGVLMSMFASSMRGITRQGQDNNNTRTLAVALDRMSTYLRTGTQNTDNQPVILRSWMYFNSGNPPQSVPARNSGVEMTFFSDLGDPHGPSLVHWYLNGSTLMQEVEAPDVHDYQYNAATYFDNPPVISVLARNIVTPGVNQRPIFSYYDNGVSTPVNNNPDPTVPLNDWDMPSISAVGVSLTTLDTGTTHRTATAQNFTVFAGNLFSGQNRVPWTSPPRNPMPPPDGSTSGQPYTPAGPPANGGGGDGYVPPRGATGVSGGLA